MLTLVSCQVNSVAMVTVDDHQNSGQLAQQSLIISLLQPLLEKRRPQRMLVLKHTCSRDLQCAPISPLQIISLNTEAMAGNAVVHTRLNALPFDNQTFEVIVLQHLVGDGSEAVLSEALRVLAPAGDIIISGLNSAGLRFRVGNRTQQFPGLRLNRIIYHLESHSINIEHCLRMGLAGMSRPTAKESLHGLSMPFSDRVVLHGHHQSNIDGSSILRFKQARPRRAASAALDGLSSREAAS